MVIKAVVIEVPAAKVPDIAKLPGIAKVLGIKSVSL